MDGQKMIERHGDRLRTTFNTESTSPTRVLLRDVAESAGYVAQCRHEGRGL